MRALLSLVFCLLLMISFVASGQQCQDTSGTTVGFINGINTSRKYADKHVGKLSDLVRPLNLDTHGVTIVPIYNHTNGIIADLVEILLDKISPTQFWDAVINSVSISPEIDKIITEKIADYIIRVIEQGNYSRTDIVNNLQSELDNNRKLLIVAHSQGTLYANSAYSVLMSRPENLNRKNIIGMIHIASLAEIVGPMDLERSTYTSFVDDIPLTLARRVFSGILPGNISASLIELPAMLSANYLLHGFSEFYIRPVFEIFNSAITFENRLRNKIIEQIVSINSYLKCESVLACFEIDPNGLPGEYIKNADGTDGGFVSTGSTVAPSAYLGAEAQVCNGAQVLGNATVIGPALIADPGTVVSDSALISGDVTVDSGARVYEQAKIFDTTRVGLEAKIFGRAEVHGDSVIIGYSEISGKAKLDGRHLVVSFGDDTKKVQIKGDVKFAGSYIIAMNALIDGTFNFTKKGAVIGDVQMLGGGEIEHTGINDQVKIFTDNLTSLGAGDFGVFLLDNIVNRQSTPHFLKYFAGTAFAYEVKF